jgi:DNA-binding GntR family transcriptional regulator
MSRMLARRRSSSHTRPSARAGREAEDRVFNAIRDAILDHRLAPGTKLVERELSELLHASRGAVRGALARLGHSLLVELRPNRGAVIANPSIAETRDLFAARRVVEAGIVRLLAAGMTPAIRARLRAFVGEEASAYGKGDLKTGQRLSIQFHKMLVELTGNSVLDRFMEHLICRTPLLALAHTGTHLAYCGAPEHRAIAEALIRGDAETAIEAMEQHLNHVEGALRLEERQAPRGLAEALHHGNGKLRTPTLTRPRLSGARAVGRMGGRMAGNA